jgi:cell division protein FtsI/penicillin-binding protein 2
VNRLVVLSLAVIAISPSARGDRPVVAAATVGSRPDNGGGPASGYSGLDLRRVRRRDGAYSQQTPDGRTIVTTFDARLQRAMERMLRENRVPWGSVVALDPRTGRVLALAQHSERQPERADLFADAGAPAASVFKVITAAALVERAGLGPDAAVCYHGGGERLYEHNLVDDPARDTACANLGDAIGRSINPVIAKLSLQHLDAAGLLGMAESFGFNKAIPFELPVETSRAEIPRDRLERGRASAGFWHTYLSPIHAALLAQAIAQDGNMLRPWMVQEVRGASGETVYRGRSRFWRTAVRDSTARTLNRMMRSTVTRGTSRRAFFPAGRPFLPGIEIAGKTGTLNNPDPYRAYTWWVGFAPADRPRIAIGVLIANTAQWRIKANDVARETLKVYLR